MIVLEFESKTSKFDFEKKPLSQNCVMMKKICKCLCCSYCKFQLLLINICYLVPTVIIFTLLRLKQFFAWYKHFWIRHMIDVEGEHKHSEEAHKTIGVIFCLLYGIFFFITLWRIYVYIRCTYNFDIGRYRGRWITVPQSDDLIRDRKLTVHIALALFSSFEVAYGAFFITEET
jgi:hypothetical protein